MSNYVIPKIDPKVFKYSRSYLNYNKTQQVLEETQVLPIIIGASRDKGGGILLHYQNIPFPRKGFPDSEVLTQINAVKRITLGYLKGFVCKANLGEYLVFILKPWFLKKQSINKFLEGYCRLCNYFLEFWYFQDATEWMGGQKMEIKKEQYYCLAAKELETLLTNFLLNLGLTENNSTNVAEIIAMIFENDDAYKLRLQDLFTESSKELMLNPYKEFKRLFGLFKERDKTAKFNGVDSLFLIFKYPKIKKAWQKAIKASNFENFQFDAIDRYWALKWGNYDAMGRSIENRQKEFLEIHKNIETPYIKMETQLK